MPRGRNPSVTSTQILLEILLNRDRAVFAAEIADELPVTGERVRQKCRDLEADGLVEITKVSSRNIYRLTPDGEAVLATELRELAAPGAGQSHAAVDEQAGK